MGTRQQHAKEWPGQMLFDKLSQQSLELLKLEMFSSDAQSKMPFRHQESQQISMCTLKFSTLGLLKPWKPKGQLEREHMHVVIVSSSNCVEMSWHFQNGCPQSIAAMFEKQTDHPRMQKDIFHGHQAKLTTLSSQ